MPVKKTTKPKKAAVKRKKTAVKKAKAAPRAAAKKKSVKKAAPKAKAKKKSGVRKYSPLAQEEVAKEMAKFKKGTAVSGKAEVPVESREQAIAIGLSKARKKGAKVPKKKK